MDKDETQEPDLSELPQAVQNTLTAWGHLEDMAKDRANFPTLRSDLEVAKARMERDHWRRGLEQVSQQKPLRAVEQEEESHADGNAGGS